jgi:branched-chain amino acid aminotransferase
MLWHDGTIISNSETILSAMDRGVSLGDGLFETLPCFNGHAFLKNAHITRMKNSAARFSLPFDQEAVEKTIDQLAKANQDPGIIRVTLTRGEGQRGLLFPDPMKPHLFATRSSWTESLAFGTARLHTSIIRRNATSPTASHKTLSYIDNVMAFYEAQQSNADDALMLDEHAHLTCTSMANLFALSGRELLTPAKSAAILPGIMRALIIDIAPSLGLNIVEKSMHRRDLLSADLVFSSNSVRLMTQITAIDGNDLQDKSNTHYNALKELILERLYEDTGYRM